MNRKALIAAVTGILAVLGSCVPLMQVALLDAPPPPRVLPLTVERPVQDAPLTLTPGRHARIALVVSLEARDTAPAGARQAAPVTLIVSDSAGHTLLAETRDTDAASARQGKARVTAAGDGRLTMHFDFPRFVVPADGRVRVSAALPATRGDGASVSAAEIAVNDAAGDHAKGVTAGVFMLLGGWVAAVAGVLSLGPRPSLPAPAGPPTADELADARRVHLVGFLLYCLPFLHLVFAGRAWRHAAARSAFVEEHAREALNFQLSVLVYLLIAFTLSLAFIGLLMAPLVLLFQVVMMREAATQARRGHRFRYPLTFRFLV